MRYYILFTLLLLANVMTAQVVVLPSYQAVQYYKAVAPTVTTTAISGATDSTGASGGTVTGSGVTARGVCWSTSTNPTIANSHTSDGTGSGSFASSIIGLGPGTPYYVRAYATNSVGTSYGSQLTLTTLSVSIGSTYGGGKVAYLLVSGDPGYSATSQHGIIAATADLPGTYRWMNSFAYILIPTSSAIGAGPANTDSIVAYQAPTATATYAAVECTNLTLGGYSDWYLPSKSELNQLYVNSAALGGGFTNNYYWSSTQVNLLSQNAWVQNLSNGAQSSTWQTQTYYYVRPVRSF